MIQDRPVCFDCCTPILTNDEIIWSPPMREDPLSPSASFHGVCLMRWRERRETIRAQMESARQAFEAHVNGECSCPRDGD